MGYNAAYWNSIIATATTKTSTENESITKRNEFPHHDCVFIMNSTWQCLGGLPVYLEHMQHLYQRNLIPNIPPIYTTYPTIKMGQMTVYDYHATLAMDGNVGIPYSLAAIDNVFSSIIPIKYNQHIYISPSTNTKSITSSSANHESQPTLSTTGSAPQLSVTAHRAGYVVGAAYFVFQRLIDETIVLYTDSTYHMSKELHLEACTLLQSTTSSSTSTTILPDVLITRPGGPAFRQFRALYTNQMDHKTNVSHHKNSKQKSQPVPSPLTSSSSSSSILQPPPLVHQAERNLMETIMAVLRRDGNVLMPVDTSGRVLELLLLLAKEWDANKYHTSYNLVFYGYMCHNVMDYAKSQLEWMSQQLNTQFTDHGQHPYRFAASNSSSTFTKRTMHFCTSMTELNAILDEESQQNPSCIVASGLSMEGGPSRDVLLKFADNPDNAILFTDSSQCYLRRTYYNVGSSNSSSSTSSQNDSHSQKLPTGAATNEGDGVNERVLTATTQDPSNLTHRTIINDDSGIITVTNSTTSTTPTTTNTLSGPNVVGAEASETNEEENEDVTNIGEALGANETKSIWTTAGQLLQAWATAKAMGTEMADSVVIDVNVPIRAPLAGHELKIFLEQEEAKRQAYIKAAEKRAMLAQVELAKGQLHLGEDDTAQSMTTMSSATSKDNNNKPSTFTTTSSSTSMVPSSSTLRSRRPKKKSRFDSTLFLKFSKPLYSTYIYIYVKKIQNAIENMLFIHFSPNGSLTRLTLASKHAVTFDVREEAVGLGQPDSIAKYGIGESVGRSGEVLEDDYGISVQPQRFTDIVSGVDPSKFASGTGRIGDDPMRRRGFGYDVDNTTGKSRTPSSLSRIVSDVDDHNDDDVDALDEQVQEALDLSEGTGIIRGRNGRLPTKVSTVTRKLEVLAEISYIPGLEGRVDARAARQSVRALQPREVIVLGGSKASSSTLNDNSPINYNLLSDEVRLLADAAKSFVKGSKVVSTPSDGETVELYIGHAAYTVRLIDKPYVPANKMDVERVDEEIPESIETVELKLGSCNVSRLNCIATGQKVALDGSIVLAPQLPSLLDEKTKPSIYLSNGEILLTDLRTELIALGMKAEYSAHTGYSQLLINGKVVLKKEQNQDSAGRMHIEGPLCEDFYAVRSILSGQFVVL